MQFRTIFGISEKPAIHAYRGFGSKSEVVVLGRITESQTELKTKSQVGLIHALRFTRSYLAKPLPMVKVRVDFAGASTIVTTNKTGVFEAHIIPNKLEHSPATEWFTAVISLPEYPNVPVKTAPVLVEGNNNTYGVISDVDDTILISNATKKAKLLYATIFKSPRKRLPFKGVGELYNAFVRGAQSMSSNPIFYVSSSHWNLYDFLKEFFSLNNLPKGPFLLKKTSSLTSLLTTVGKHNQKHDSIVAILKAYPRLPFILVGDSGQKDAEIYANIAQEFPGRIKSIYIRDLNIGDNKIVEKAISSLQNSVPLIAAKTSYEIAEHAFKNNLIGDESLAKVKLSVQT